MDYHQNARLAIHSREQLARRVVLEGCTRRPRAAGSAVIVRKVQRGCGTAVRVRIGCAGQRPPNR
jgi:hypothetical protein